MIGLRFDYTCIGKAFGCIDTTILCIIRVDTSLPVRLYTVSGWKRTLKASKYIVRKVDSDNTIYISVMTFIQRI